MRGDDLRQDAPLVVGLANEAHISQTEVPETTVDELRRRARGCAPEVTCIHESDGEAGPRCMSSDPGTDDPAADDQQIETASGELLGRAAPI
jgi:hypothetical protein